MLIFHIFDCERRIFSTEALLVGVKFRIILTNQENCWIEGKEREKEHYEFE
jgi:hypothetical protein